MFKQRRGVFNGTAGSRFGSSDQHLLEFPPSRLKTKRFREILGNQINGVSQRANNFRQQIGLEDTFPASDAVAAVQPAPTA
jgi:hypothetical protein